MANEVHFPSPLGDFTLCGDSVDGVFLDEQPVLAQDGDKVTCEKCIIVINACEKYAAQHGSRRTAAQGPRRK